MERRQFSNSDSRGGVLPTALSLKIAAMIRTAMLCASLLYLLLRVAPLHALDPNKRVTQYMHTAWRTQDGSLPAGMYQLRKPRMVSSGSYPFPASTGSTAFGFCPGICLPVSDRSDQ